MAKAYAKRGRRCHSLLPGGEYYAACLYSAERSRRGRPDQMQIGVAIGRTLPFEQQTELAVEAARLGFDYITTNETPGETDAFQICLMRWLATREVMPGGITNAISVSPAGMRNPVGLAMSAMTTSAITGGKLILGLGTGRAYREAYRRMWGIPHRSTLRMMRDTLTALRALTHGEMVTYDSPHFKLEGARVRVEASPPPLYLAALGPKMVKLGRARGRPGAQRLPAGVPAEGSRAGRRGRGQGGTCSLRRHAHAGRTARNRRRCRGGATDVGARA